MTSVRERDRKKAAQSRRASMQAAGRPRQEGDRYPSGKLKPPKPNEKVIEMRRALAGPKIDITKAENPLDLMLAHEWITEDQHQAARAYAFLYIRAGVDLPKLKTADLGEAGNPDGDRAPQPTFRLRPEWMDIGDDRAMDQLQVIWAALTPAQKSELFNVCILESWPQWVIYKAMGKDVPAVWDRKRIDLISGLKAVLAVVAPPRSEKRRRA